MPRNPKPETAAQLPTATAPSCPAWLVYILRCADDTLYTGCTNDLARRLRSHGAGRVKYTRGRLPVELLHHEPVASHGDALRRELAIKRLSRAQKLNLCEKHQLAARKNAPSRRRK